MRINCHILHTKHTIFGNIVLLRSNICVSNLNHIYIVYMWQMSSVFSHESAQRNDAGHLIYQWWPSLLYIYIYTHIISRLINDAEHLIYQWWPSLIYIYTYIYIYIYTYVCVWWQIERQSHLQLLMLCHFFCLCRSRFVSSSLPVTKILWPKCEHVPFFLLCLKTKLKHYSSLDMSTYRNKSAECHKFDLCTSWSERDGRHFADGNSSSSMKTFVYDKSVLVQTMAWHLLGVMTLPEPILTKAWSHIAPLSHN